MEHPMNTHGSLAGRRVAVIGATGFIGSYLVARLSGEGAHVLSIALTRARLANLALVARDQPFATCDITHGERLTELFREFQPQVVYHLAAHPDGQESDVQMRESLRVNGLGTLNVLDAAQAAESEVLVLADSCKVYGNGPVPHRSSHPVDPTGSYAIAKAAAWQFCRLTSLLSGLKVVGLRLTFVYGKRQNWNLVRYVEQCVERGQPIRLQGGSQTRDPVYVDDAVDAFVAAATRSEGFGESIPIGGGREISVADFCREILNAMGAQAEIIEDATPPRATEMWRSVADTSEARARLGWAPRTSLAEGLAKTVGRQTAAAGPVLATTSPARTGV